MYWTNELINTKKPNLFETMQKKPAPQAQGIQTAHVKM